MNDEAGLAIGAVGGLAGKTTVGLVGSSIRFYPSGWAGGSAGKIATISIEDAAKSAGYAGFVIGVGLDTATFVNNPTPANAAVLGTGAAIGYATTFVLGFPEDVAVAGTYILAKEAVQNPQGFLNNVGNAGGALIIPVTF